MYAYLQTARMRRLVYVRLAPVPNDYMYFIILFHIDTLLKPRRYEHAKVYEAQVSMLILSWFQFSVNVKEDNKQIIN